MNRFAHILKTRSGKFLAILWLLILAILIGTPTITFFLDRMELLGNIVFSIFPMAVLLNISVVLAFIVEKGTVRIAKLAWVCMSIAVIVFALGVAGSGEADAYKSAEIVFAYSMLILSFPISFLAPFVVSAIGYLFNLDEFGIYISNLVAWGVFFVLGYLQWFKLVPWIIEKVHGKKMKPA